MGIVLLLVLLSTGIAYAQMATGTYTGNSWPVRTIEGLGFEPDLVLIKGDRDRPAVIRLSTMNDGEGKKLAHTVAVETGFFGSFTADGFEIGSDEHVNRSGTRYDWLAFAELEGICQVGSYTGNWIDDRDVSVGFAPDYVIVVPEGGYQGLQRSSAMPDGFCLPFDDEDGMWDGILGFGEDGFRISGQNDVNRLGQRYHYVAWREISGGMAVGSYVGDRADDRDIKGVGLAPAWVLTKGDSREDGIHRTASLGDLGESLYFESKDHEGNRIQALSGDGFQVGSDRDVNDNGKDYYWTAFGRRHDLSLTMSADRDTVHPGDEVVYTLLLHNPGPDRLSAAIVTEKIPAALEYLSSWADFGTYDAGAGRWTLDGLAAGATAQLDVTTRVGPGSGDVTVANVASIGTYSDNDPDTDNNVASVPLVIRRAADLRIAGAVSDSLPEMGDVVRFSLGLQNGGPDAATGVSVTGALPAGLEYVSHSASVGSYDPILGEWTINTLGLMTLARMDVDVRVLAESAGQSLVWSPFVSSDLVDLDPDDNIVDIALRVVAADLGLVLDVDDTTPVPGDRLEFTLALDNAGPDPAADVVVGFALPAGLEFVSATADQGAYDQGSGVWTVGSLDAGGSLGLHVSADVAAGAFGGLICSAGIDAASPSDPDTGNDTSSVTIEVQNAVIQLDGGVDDAYPDVGQTITFNITAENTSAVTAKGLVVNDDLPVGLTYLNAVPSRGTYDPVGGDWEIGDLTAGASCVLQLTAEVDVGTGGRTLVNTAEVVETSHIQEQRAGDALAIPVTVRAADLRLIKNVDDPTPVQGAQVDFTILITNQGPDTAYAVTAADTLPAGLLFVSSLADRGAYDAATGLWAFADLPAGETATLTITAEVQLDVGSGDSAVNTARILACDQEDTDPSNNVDDASLTQQSADLALGLSVDETAPAAGQSVLYTLVLSNVGPSDAGGVAVLDTLPTGATYVSCDPPTADYDPVTGLWTVGDLTAGASDTLRIAAVIDAGASGATLVDAARVSASDQADPDGTNNQAEAALTVRAVDLAVSLVADDPAPTVGDTVVVDLSLDNAGPDTAETVQADLRLPAGLDLLSWDATAGAYDEGAGSWSLTDLATAAGETLSLTLEVLPGSIGTSQDVDALVAASLPGDPEAANDVDSLSLTIRGADLSLDKTVNNAAPFAGETVLYTLTLLNEGPDAVVAAEIVDQLPVGLEYVSHTPPWADYDPGTGVWAAGAVAADQTLSLFLQARVVGVDPGETRVNTAVVSGSDLADPDTSDDQGSAELTVPAADLTVSFAVNDTTPAQGESVDFTAIVSNGGPDDATGVVLDLTLPEGMSFTSSMPGGYDPGTGRWIVDDLAAAEQQQIVVTAEVQTSAIGDTLQVAAAVDEVDQGDSQPGDESAAVTLYVQPDADLSVDLVVAPGEADVGETVVWTVGLENLGPSVATGVVLADTLPAGVEPMGVEAGAGTYDAVTRTWTLPTLAVDERVELILSAVPAAGTGGSDLNAVASVIATDQADRNDGNDRAEDAVHVLGAGLVLVSYADLTTPNEGEDVNFTLSVTNLGPDAASGVTVLDTLPVGLSYVGHTPPTESYTQNPDGSWTWDVGGVEAQTPRVLFVRTRVDAGTTGQALRHAVRVVPGAEEDPSLDDNGAENLIAVEGVDLDVAIEVDDATPAEGDTLAYTLTLVNHGPNAASGIALQDSLGDGLVLLGAEPAEDFNFETGVWSVSSLDPDESRELVVQARVDARTGGTEPLHAVRVLSLDQVDPEPANDAAELAVAVQVPATGHVLVATLTLDDAPVVCLADPVDLLALEFVNWSVVPDTLSGLTLANLSMGQGTDAQLDAAWSSLAFWREVEGERSLLLQRDDPFTDGVADLDDLGLILAPADTVRLIVSGAASSLAHDGDTFALGVSDATQLVFTREVAVDAEWPMSTASSHRVDAFVAAQAKLPQVDVGVLVPGGGDQLVLAVDLPADGYAAHALNELAVLNQGTAQPGSEIDAVRAWRDDGDGVFAAATDTLLGEMVWTGDRWLLGGLDSEIPVGGARFMVTVEPSASAEGARSVKMVIPIDGVAVDGGADGPLDAPLVYPFEQVVSGTDRVWFSAATLAWREERPDGGEDLLLHLSATNTFDEARTLTSLSIDADVTSPYTGDADILDDVVAQLRLRDDVDLDGAYDETSDTAVLGAATPVEGVAVFGGLAWTVPPASTRHLFVTARLSPAWAADGDRVSAAVGSAVDLQFDGDTDLAGDWPLGSGGLVVDGLLAASVEAVPTPSRTLAPDEGPVPALELVVPRNGHADDVLQGIRIAELGTASPHDLQDIRLYRDGGDGVFDGGDADDIDLGALKPDDGFRLMAGLGEPVGEDGLRLFVGVVAASTFADSATVHLSLPVDGLAYDSGNDGPLDAAIDPGGILLLSRAPLQVALTVEPDEVVVGQSVTVRMTVRNVGVETAYAVSPTDLGVAGDGALGLLSGPEPGSLGLAPGEVDTFTWTYQAVAVGDVVLTGAAAGETGGNAPLASLTVGSNGIRVLAAPPSLVMTPLSQLPFVVNAGQTDVSALTLGLVHPGRTGSAAVRVDTLRFDLRDGEDAPVAAGGVLARVRLRVDGDLIRDLVVSAEHGDSLLLVPDTDLLLAPGDARVLTLALDIAAAVGSEFRLESPVDGLVVVDAVAGDAVDVSLASGDFPVASELTSVVAGAGALELSAGEAGASEASRGQSGVRLAEITAANPGDPELGGGIQLGVIAVSLYDGAGGVLDEPAAIVSGLSVWSDDDHLAWLEVSPSLSPPYVLPLGTPVTVAAGDTARLEVRADLRSDAPLGAVAAAVGSVEAWDARDLNSGVPVPVVATPDPLVCSVCEVVRPAELLHLGGRPGGSSVLTQGAEGQTVLEIDLRHPAEAGTAPVALDTLHLHCVDGSGAGLATNAVMSRITVLSDGGAVGAALANGNVDGSVDVPVNGVSVSPSAILTLEVTVDLLSGSSAEVFALLLDTDDVVATDAYLGTPVAVTADAGVVVPLSTGELSVREASDELVVGVADLMPAALSALDGETSVLRLTLENPAEATAGDLLVDGVKLRVRDVAESGAVLGGVAGELRAYRDDVLWGSSGELAAGDTLTAIDIGEGLVLEPGEQAELEIRLVVAETPSLSSISLGLTLDDLSARQPEGELVTVRVLPASGQVFPFWTEVGSVSSGGLEASYSNYPNPFAAGREATTFVFALESDASVDLKLYTSRGVLVRTLLSGEALDAGLHQDVCWDGRNGNGDAVRNGVYIADLVVRDASGATTRLRRKVAVVR